MSSTPEFTVLHYTGSRWDGSGLHAVIRQLAQNPACRSILGVTAGFVPEKTPRLHLWRGPAVKADRIDPANLLRSLVVAWRIRRWLARGRHRIFHGHSRVGLLVGLWLRLLGARRLVISVHVYGRQRWFYRFARFYLGNRLVWLTPAMKCHYGCGDSSWEGCITNGLALPFIPSVHRGPVDGVMRLGGAGMIVRWKRWDLVLTAMARLPAASTVEFLHIGGTTDSEESRTYERELHAMVRSHGLGARVRWLGWQPSSANLLRQVDAIVVPSDGEPFSMIALEALFAGVPVIATRGGGPEDFILNGVNGWLVPRGDAAALAQQIERCLDPVAWRSLRVAPEHLRRFSVLETLAARWTKTYAAL